MTSEEKSRLYKAIDYQENAPAAVFPEEFVDTSLSFLLRYALTSCTLDTLNLNTSCFRN